MAVLEKGQRIKTTSGKELEVIEKLGEGGQGIVYKVNYDGRELALKWYFAHKLHNKEDFYDNIQENIKSGAPAKNFLWPIEITEITGGSFGYLMELRPKEYQDFSKFLLAKVRFASVDALINAGLSIVHGFRKLHNSGLSYQDLNDGNFFVNPQTGDVLICDNDNVAPYGASMGIAGKCRYMAPEVVVGKKKPDVHTDRFSLAVILYMLLFLNHPLEGARTLKAPCMTEEKEKEFFGVNPVFTWDAMNDTNRPVKGVHTNEIRLWPIFPKFIKDIFMKSFSQDMMTGKDIQHRVTEKEWQEAFVTLRGTLIKCSSCNELTFIDNEKNQCDCVNCDVTTPKYSTLKVKRYQVVLAPEQNLYACHTISDSDEFMVKTATVIVNKKDPTKVGLRNEGDTIWTAILPDGSTKTRAKGDVVPISKGIKIDFGSGSVGTIV